MKNLERLGNKLGLLYLLINGQLDKNFISEKEMLQETIQDAWDLYGQILDDTLKDPAEPK